MSKFYERWLNSQEGKDSHKKSTKERDADSLKAVDPTAMSKNLTEAKDGKGPSRRVQIINDSMDVTNSTKLVSELKTHFKTAASRSFLADALGAHYLFENLSEIEVDKIIDCMSPLSQGSDTVIIQEGEEGDLFYCLEAGEADALVEGVGKVAHYSRGGCFGELALMYSSPRAASVISRSHCSLWTLDLKTFRSILANSSSNEQQTRVSFLEKCLFLESLNQDQLRKVAMALQHTEHPDGDIVVKQGDAGSTFYIIEAGVVKVTQLKSNGMEVELATLRQGDYFGEMALILAESRHATVSCVGPVSTLSLDQEKFNLLLGGVQGVLASRMRIRILKSVPLLSRMPESTLVRLGAALRIQTFAAGSYIIRQGDEGSRFYIISEGDIKCTRTIQGVQEEELIRLGPQEFFGERALITAEKRKANVIAVTPVECLVLERSAFQSLIGDGINDALDVASWRHNRGNDEELAKASEEVDYANAASTDFAFQDLKVMRTVGVGTFGRVKLVQHLPSGMVAALKCVSKTTLLKTKQVQNIMNERNFLYACGKCPFVMGLYQTFNLPNEVFLLSELVQGGELWSYIYERTSGTIPRNSVGGFAMPAVKFYAANILLAFQYLHQKGIMYRDLKPENLLIGQDGYLKLIDFGFAKKLPCSKNGVLQTKTYTLCGTPEYLAPEVVLSKGYDWAVDCWSFGCILYELYLGRTPFAAEFTTKIFQNIVSCEKTLKFHPGMDPQHVELIKRLLIPNPALRMGNLNGGLKDVMEHNFFSSVDFEKLNSMSTNPPYIPAVIDNLDVSNYDTYDEVQVEPYTGDQNAFALF